jgi:hypothetical protein
MKKIVGLLAVIALVVLLFSWQRHHAKVRALNSGEVYVRDQPSGPAKPLPAPAQSPASDEIATTATPQPAAAASGAQPTAEPTPAAAPTLPNSDSIPRNPPNGLAFAGSGKFQLYRQGDITWRLNTQTGDACILFATDAQWRLHRVYQAGCGTHGETTVATGD